MNNILNDTNIDIALYMSNTYHFKVVQIFLPNPVGCLGQLIYAQDPNFITWRTKIYTLTLSRPLPE